MRDTLTLIILSFTWRWGIEAMIIGQIIQGVLAYFINGYYTGQLLKYGYWEQLRDILPYAFTTGLMAAGVLFVRLISIENQVLFLIFQVSVGTLIYTSICFVFRLQAFAELMDIIRRSETARSRKPVTH